MLDRGHSRKVAQRLFDFWGITLINNELIISGLQIPSLSYSSYCYFRDALSLLSQLVAAGKVFLVAVKDDLMISIFHLCKSVSMQPEMSIISRPHFNPETGKGSTSGLFRTQLIRFPVNDWIFLTLSQALRCVSRGIFWIRICLDHCTSKEPTDSLTWFTTQLPINLVIGSTFPPLPSSVS